MMILPSHLNTIQDTVKFLMQEREMTLREAEDEWKRIWRAPIEEDMEDMLQTESNYWRER